MLYLHCGWPRTSTSSLQAALAEHREELAGVGVLYPERWRDPSGLAHHRIYDLLSASLDSPEALDELEHFLARHAGEDVLISAEGLSNWLLSRRKQDALLRFLGAAREAMPVKCVWSLRRLDDVLASLFLLGVREGIRLPPPAEFLEGGGYRPYPFDVRQPDWVFDGLSRVEGLADVEVAYVEYDPAGAHNAELLRELGIPEPLRSAIQSKLESGRRRNESVSQKEATVLFNLEELTERLGVELNRAALVRGFECGELRFDDDGRCELADESLRVGLHLRALAAANRHGVTAYVEFFDGTDVTAASPVGLDLGSLTDDDLRRLSEHVTSPKPPGPEECECLC
jgi:hypothetical protein